eukprot:s171_g11.t1
MFRSCPVWKLLAASHGTRQVPVEDDGSLTREELLELNKQPDQRPARPRLPTAFTQTGVAGASSCEVCQAAFFEGYCVAPVSSLSAPCE